MFCQGGHGEARIKSRKVRTLLRPLRARRAPLLVGDKPTLAPALRWVINLRTNKRGLVATALGLNIGQSLA